MTLQRGFLRRLFLPKYEIYTDGSVKCGRSAWSYVMIRRGRVVQEASGVVSGSDCNAIEIQAALAALKALKSASRVTIYTDSRVLLEGVLNSKARPKRFEHLFSKIEALCSGHDLSWCWVKSHSGNVYNERCDLLCAQAR